MRVLAIDPGNKESGWVLVDSVEQRPVAFGIDDNFTLRAMVPGMMTAETHFAIEMLACYGMAVGAEVLETGVWIGRFIENSGLDPNAWRESLVYRRDVKLTLCNSPRAKDGNVRQAILDLYGPGKDVAVGRKKSPGPLYGFKSHLWAAMGVALTYLYRVEGRRKGDEHAG